MSNDINAPKYAKENWFTYTSSEQKLIKPYAGLLVIPQATINPVFIEYRNSAILHRSHPQSVASRVISAPYINIFMSKRTDCNPVQYPVPTKKRHSPRFLNEFNTRGDICKAKSFLCITYPMIKPIINVHGDRESNTTIVL